MNSDAELTRHALRRQARAARRALDDAQRALAATQLCSHLLAAPLLMSARRVAAYAAVASELDLMPLIAALIERGTEVYLPHIEHTAPHMRFARWRGQKRFLLPNRFGIPEPVGDAGSMLDAQQLDVVLLPLVAFDDRGQRLGSGAGYYDRALAFRLQSEPPPWLIGIGYACQQVSAIPAASWDVPLDGIATETGMMTLEAADKERGCLPG